MHYSVAQWITEKNLILNRGRAQTILALQWRDSLNDDLIKWTSFIITSLDILLENKVSNNNLKKFITDWDPDHKVDAIVIQGKEIKIFDFKTSWFSEDSILNYLHSVEEFVLKKSPSQSTLQNPRLKKMLVLLHSIRQHHITIYIVRWHEKTRTWKTLLISQKEQQLKNRYRSLVDIVYLDERDLLNKALTAAPQIPSKRWKVKILEGNNIMDYSGTSTVMIKLKLTEILSYVDKVMQNWENIFHKNVRIPQDEINFGTSLWTTISKQPDNFHLLHNWITVVASNIDHQSSTLYIDNPQIVNGAQTIWYLYSAHWLIFSNRKKNKNVFLYVKIIEANETLAENICETANTQKKIETWDLRSNDKLQMLLESVFCNLSEYGFIRKKSKTRNSSNQIFLTDFYQWFYSCYFWPLWAKNNKSRLFSRHKDFGLYDSIAERILKAKKDQIINIAKIWVFVRERQKIWVHKSLIKDANMHLIAGIFAIINSRNKNLEEAVAYFDSLLEQLSVFLTQIKEQNAWNSRINNSYLFNRDSENRIWLFLQQKISIIS